MRALKIPVWFDALLDPQGIAHGHDLTLGHWEDPDGLCWCEPENRGDEDGDVWVHREVH